MQTNESQTNNKKLNKTLINLTRKFCFFCWVFIFCFVLSLFFLSHCSDRKKEETPLRHHTSSQWNPRRLEKPGCFSPRLDLEKNPHFSLIWLKNLNHLPTQKKNNSRPLFIFGLSQASMDEAKFELRIAELIYQTFSIAFLIVGIVTNLFSAIIYSNKKMRKTSYSVYLFALAIADLFVTINGNTRLVLMSFETANPRQHHINATMDPDENKFRFKGFDIRETSIVACRLHRFFTYYFLQMSSCLLCLLSIDRFFGIVLALKAFRFNRSSIAHKVVLIVGFFITLFNAHFLVFMGYYETVTDSVVSLNHTGIANTRRIVVCDPDPENLVYKKFWHVFFFFDTIVYTLIPFVVMITCNVCIVAKIVKSRVRSKQVVIARQKSRKCLSTLHANQIVKNTSSMLATEKRISIILVSISFSFLVFTLPVFVIEHITCKFDLI